MNHENAAFWTMLLGLAGVGLGALALTTPWVIIAAALVAVYYAAGRWA